MEKYLKKVTDSERYQSLLTTLRLRKLGKGRVPILLVIQTLYKKLQQTNVHEQASSIAFSFLLSLFPAILFLFSLIPFIAGYVQIPNLSLQVQELLKEFTPEGIYQFIAPTIVDVIEKKRSDLLSFGFLFALYAATSGVVEMMNNFNKNYVHSERRSYFKKRLLAAMLAFLFAFLLIMAVAIIIIGQLALHFILEFDLPPAYNVLKEEFVFYSIVALRYLIAFMIFYMGISIIYYVAPANAQNWRFFSTGSTIAAILVILSTNGFSYYLSHFATYNKIYGSIGTLIALMIWLYLLAWILILGFSLNASIAEARVAHQAEIDKRYQLLKDISLNLEDDPED